MEFFWWDLKMFEDYIQTKVTAKPHPCPLLPRRGRIVFGLSTKLTRLVCQSFEESSAGLARGLLTNQKRCDDYPLSWEGEG